MRVIGGRDYYDSVMGYGHDDSVMFIRQKDKRIAINELPCHSLRIDSLTHRFNVPGPNFYGVQIYFCGRLFHGIIGRFTVRGEYPSRRHVYWTYDDFRDGLMKYGAGISEHHAQKIREYFAANTDTHRAKCVKKKITIAIFDEEKDVGGYNRTNSTWKIDGADLKDYQFFRVKDHFTAYQDIDMWVGGVIPQGGREIVTITDNKILLHKAGFDKFSFRKDPTKRKGTNMQESESFLPFNINFARIKKYAIIVGILVFLFVLGANSYFIVNEGERGILTRQGRFVSVEEPGFGLKFPFIDDVYNMEIRNISLSFESGVYSSDSQQYTAKITLNYNILPENVEWIFVKEGKGYATKRLIPLTETAMKEVAGKFNAQRTIQERDVYGTQVKGAIASAALEYNIHVSEVQIQNVDFSDQFERAIETAMLAKAKVEEERQILEQQRIKAETVVITATATANAARETAKGEADARVSRAMAEATEIEALGTAEAKAIALKGEALANTPKLVDYTFALAAMKWNGTLPNQFVPGSAIPFLSLTPKE